MATKRRVTLIGGIGDRQRMTRNNEETLRNTGQFRRLVLWQVRAGKDPSPADIAAALRQKPPDPRELARITLTDQELESLEQNPPAGTETWLREHIGQDRVQTAIDQAAAAIASDTAALCDYVASMYVLGSPRKTGRKGPARTLQEERRIAAAYFRERAHEEAECEAARGHRRANLQPVKERVAREFGISVRTLERCLKGLTARIS